LVEEKHKNMKTSSLLKLVKRHGILLQVDSKLPSLITSIVGEPIKGSWWGHARGSEIFHAIGRLDDTGEVVVTRLLCKKLTYVHRDHWPSLVSIGLARESWQTQDLGINEKGLLKILEKEGELRSDKLPSGIKVSGKDLTEVVKRLERYLLVCTDEIHTETGAHAKVISDWRSWAKRHGLETGKLPAVESAKKKFEKCALDLGVPKITRAVLPWGE
jgi:hypothetical protein